MDVCIGRSMTDDGSSACGGDRRVVQSAADDGAIRGDDVSGPLVGMLVSCSAGSVGGDGTFTLESGLVGH